MLKTLLCTFFIILFNQNTSSSQAVSVPEQVDSSFAITYAKAMNQEWMQEGENFSVSFRVSNGQSVHLVYDSLGNVREKYMALPSRSIPAEIIKYLKENYSGLEASNFWVKQKGAERIYKVTLGMEIKATGTIAGSSFGSSSTDSLQLYADKNANVEEITNASKANPIYIYFDRFCNKVKAEEAKSEFFVAKKPENTSVPFIAKNSKNDKKKRNKK